MPDATPVDTHPVTGQRLVRYRATARKAAVERRAGSRQSSPQPVPATPDLIAGWLMQDAAVRELRKYGAKPKPGELAKAIEALRDAGDAVIARVRQSYADAVQ